MESTGLRDFSRSPKRKNETPADTDTAAENAESPSITESESENAEEIAIISSTAAPDSNIDPKAAIAYWSSTEPTINGILGGYPQVSRIDIQGSSNFLAKLRRQSKHHPPSKQLKRAVDCGAGIGRITTGFLSKIAEKVDIVEPVKSFTAQIKVDNLGEIYNVGLEDWHPEKEDLRPYDVIWHQWCLGQLTDDHLVEYLKRLRPALSVGGWIVVKENLSNHHLGKDVFDETDSSVTRTDIKFRKLFDEADLKIVSTELQKGMPNGLYAVRAYALQPR